MTDKVEVINFPEVGGSKAAVALDLMRLVMNAERKNPHNASHEKGSREYYLSLFEECYKATHGYAR